MEIFLSKINCTAVSIREWAKGQFGNIFKVKRVLLARFEDIQICLAARPNGFLTNLGDELQMELENILKQEELLWLQKSRQDWLREGDWNTKFFNSDSKEEEIS